MTDNLNKCFRRLMVVLLVALPISMQPNGPVGWVTPAAAQTVSVDIFFEPLAQHGRWLRTSGYGYVWVPARVAADWRPYTHGHWEYTRRIGWVWVSDEDWGWATYHYGRWGYDDDYGWFWVPGNRWAPAWVSWQTSDDYFGWAPLPPSGSGYAFSAKIGAAAIGIGAWRFVSTRDFLSRDLGARIIAPARNSEIIRRTRAAGAVRIVNKVVVNNVINITNVEKTTRQKVVVRDIREVNRPQTTKIAGDAIQVYRPQISSRRPRATPKDAVQVKSLTNRASKVKADAPAQGRGPQKKPAPGQPDAGSAPTKALAPTKGPAIGDTGDKAGGAKAPAKSAQPPVPARRVSPERTGKVTPKRLPDKSAPKATVPAKAPKARVATPPPTSKGTGKASPPPRPNVKPESKAPRAAPKAAPNAAPRKAASPPSRPAPKAAKPDAKAAKGAPPGGGKKAAPQDKKDGPPEK